MEKIKVLFVCTGNICRSPTAHAVFAAMVEKAGLQNAFLVGSAGTHGYHIGHKPDERAIKIAASRGVDMESLRARQATQEDFEAFDYILAMDMGHYNILKQWDNPNAPARLLMFAADDVKDPYYGGMGDFEEVYDVIERGCAQLLTKILTEITP